MCITFHRTQVEEINMCHQKPAVQRNGATEKTSKNGPCILCKKKQARQTLVTNLQQINSQSRRYIYIFCIAQLHIAMCYRI